MFSTYGLTHPLINYSDLIWHHARGPKQIETVYHGPAAPFPWTCSAWDGAFGLQQCCSQLCKNLAVHAGASSRSCARTRVRNHGCSIPRRNTRQHNELKQLKLNHGVLFWKSWVGPRTWGEKWWAQLFLHQVSLTCVEPGGFNIWSWQNKINPMIL